jgi:hypothetical protein
MGHSAADLDTDNGTFQRDQSTVVVDILATLAEPFLGTVTSSCCALYIDFVRSFRSFRQNPDLVRQDFRESPGDR